MMYSDSEQDAKQMIEAMKTLTSQKTPHKETRYEKWKRSRKSDRNWRIWCCWIKKDSSQTNGPLLGET